MLSSQASEQASKCFHQSIIFSSDQFLLSLRGEREKNGKKLTESSRATLSFDWSTPSHPSIHRTSIMTWTFFRFQLHGRMLLSVGQTGCHMHTQCYWRNNCQISHKLSLCATKMFCANKCLSGDTVFVILKVWDSLARQCSIISWLALCI
jgi:hypothetical protein